MDATLELCFNAWILVDPYTGIVQTAAAKPYALAGDDESKLAVLRALAATDFYTAPRTAVPGRWVVRVPDGRELPGAMHISQLNESGPEFDAMGAVASPPPQILMRDGIPEGFVLPVPEEPLFVRTVVEERHDGTLVPVVNRAEG